MPHHEIFRKCLEIISLGPTPELTQALKKHPDAEECLPLKLNLAPDKPYKQPSPSEQSENSDVLYVYGIDDWEFYELSESWLEEDPKRYLVFVEDRLNYLHQFVHSPQGLKLLSNPQILLIHWEHGKTGENLLIQLAWFFIGLIPKALYLEEHNAERASKFRELKTQIMCYAAHASSAFYTTMLCGENFYMNYYSNIQHINKSLNGAHYFQKFCNIPAIICGAGPSLDKNLDLLYSLQNKALILSGGSSLISLNDRGITPHFTSILDPTEQLEAHLENHYAFETSLFYRNRAFFQTVLSHHGPRLHIGGSGRYHVSKWFEKELGIEDRGNLQEGVSVSTFTFSIAKALGCHPIIFVGLDLAYTDKHDYATGVENKLLGNILHPQEKLISYPDIHGKRTLTNSDWISESTWISKFAATSPEVCYINATEGGIGFKGIPNMSLSEVCDKYFLKQYDLESRIHAERHNSSLGYISKETVYNKIVMMKDSLERSLDLCGKILEDIQDKVLITLNADTSHSSIPTIALLENLTNEIAFQYILAPLLEYFNRSLEREEYRIRRLHPIHTTTSDLEFLKCEVKKITYLQQAAECNLDIIEYSLEEAQNALKQGN
ncbi:MAG: hypothetical protein ACI8RA_001377 [Chlamydiales bacterium]|jgi:hypothetical protein